jgi:hypothetical protein
MRYFHAGKALRSFANAMFCKRLSADDLSDYMRRDLGLIDGRPAACADFAEGDGRTRRLDLLTLTPYAS